MPKLGEAYVIVRASLAPLKQGLALAKGIVTAATKGISGAFRGAMSLAWSAVRTTFSAIYRLTMWLGAEIYKWLKRGMIAFVGASVAATYAAMKQESAEYELMSQLKATGEYTEQLMNRFREFAKQMQLATIFSDEETMALMRMALTMGAATKDIERLVKAAIALSSLGGRISPMRALRALITGKIGELPIKGLDKAKTDAERIKIINEAIARGLEQQKAKAEAGIGALTQVKNLISEIGEAYGKHLLPGFKTFHQWLKNNYEWLSKWANRIGAITAAVSRFIIGVFKTTFDWIMADWKGFLKTLGGFFISAFMGIKEGLAPVFESIANDFYNKMMDAVSAVVSALPIWMTSKLFPGMSGKVEERERLIKSVAQSLAGPIRHPYTGEWMQRKPTKEQYREAEEHIRRTRPELWNLFERRPEGEYKTALQRFIYSFYMNMLAFLETMPPEVRDKYQKAFEALKKGLAEALGLPGKAKNKWDYEMTGPPLLKKEDIEGKTAKIGKLGGFVSFAESWQRMAEGVMNPIDSMVSAQKDGNDILDKIESNTAEIRDEVAALELGYGD